MNRLARAVLAGRELNEKAELGARAELEQFDVVAGAFHATPRRGRRRGTRRSEPLGFGVEGLTAAVTTLVLAVAADTLSQLTQEPTRRTATRFASWIRRVLLRRPARPTDAEPAVSEAPLTADQMRRIHHIADRHARRLRVPAQTAEAIANGIVAELAMAPAGPTPPSGPDAPVDASGAGEPAPGDRRHESP